jgi:hypothetical protein
MCAPVPDRSNDDMRTRSSTAALCLAVLLGTVLSGCGGNDDPAPAKADRATSAPADDSTASVPQAPEAVCDFKETWQPIDQQLSDAEGDLENAALWGDTADAVESVTAPEAITIWSLLAGRVRSYADALASDDPTEAQGFRASQMQQLRDLHTSLHELFDQSCS